MCLPDRFIIAIRTLPVAPGSCSSMRFSSFHAPSVCRKCSLRLAADPGAVLHRPECLVRYGRICPRGPVRSPTTLWARPDSLAQRIRKFLLESPIPSSVAVSESSTVPSPWIVAGTLVGLPLALWAYKCLMMAVFQRKIIYMGGIPLGSRSEEPQINDKNLRLEQITVPNGNVALYGIVVSGPRLTENSGPPLVIMYLQGNAGNPLHRIPKFRLLVASNLGREVKVVAAAPRSYWKSTNKSPSETGFLSDYGAVLQWISASYPHSPVILYGHSIGGSIAVKLLASLPQVSGSHIRGLVLENAFTSIPDMVRTVYPSKWLPYYYLGPLVFDKWDALRTLQRCALVSNTRSLLRNVILGPCSVLILNSAQDELVPPQMGQDMLDAVLGIRPGSEKYPGTGPKRIIIPSALHDDAFTKRQWKDAMMAYLAEVIATQSHE